jgi:UDP-N-acetyl-2-amino-2-deoxyglucuronate dehydrogenase
VFRVGLIGDGKAGKLHATAAATLDDVRVVAVADPDPPRGESLARRLEARYVRDASDLLALDLEAVVIALPHASLAPAVRVALAAGKHVLVEKPMAVALAEADAVVAASRAASLNLQVGYVHRYRPEAQAARRLIADGAIGRPTLVVEDHSLSGDETVGAWVWDVERAGGGALMYSGIHGIDRVRWLTGQEVQVAFAQTGRFAHERGGEDNAAATLRLDGGCLAAVNQNFTPFPIPNRWQTHVYGTEGVLRMVHASLELVDRSGSRSVELAPQDHFTAQFREFVAAIRERPDPFVPAEEGRANLAVVLALYESARTGRAVDLRAPATEMSRER